MLHAAVELLGTEGLRAPDPRPDGRAGEPAQGLDNQLLPHSDPAGTGAHAWISECELAEADSVATAPESPADLVEVLAAAIDFLTGPNRTMTAARLALFIEASDNRLSELPYVRLRVDLYALSLSGPFAATTVLAGLTANEH